MRREKSHANLPCLCTSGQAPYRQPDEMSGVPGIAAPLSNIVRSAKTYLVSKECRRSSLSPLLLLTLTLTLMRKTLTRALQSTVSSPRVETAVLADGPRSMKASSVIYLVYHIGTLASREAFGMA